MHRNGSTGRVLDLLETYDGRWFTVENVTDLFPDLKPATVRRTLYRLRDKHWVETRYTQVQTDWMYGDRNRAMQGWRPVPQFRVPNRTHLDKVWG